jgi:hypothetical protein
VRGTGAGDGLRLAYIPTWQGLTITEVNSTRQNDLQALHVRIVFLNVSLEEMS